MDETVITDNTHTVTYNPLKIADADQDTSYLKIHNTNNVQNYRVPEVTREEDNLK